MSPGEIACIVLASGLSHRFGKSDKLAADLCGKPVLNHVLDVAAQIEFGATLVVTNRSCVNGWQVVRNPQPEAGQGFALSLGLETARKQGWKTALIMLGDMPLISPLYLEKMISRSDGKDSVVSCLKSTRMPPALFNGFAIHEILSQRPEAGARDVFGAINPINFEIPAEYALDVDTQADLVKVAEVMKVRSRDTLGQSGRI